MSDRLEPTPLMLKTVAVVEHVLSETVLEDVELLGITICLTVFEHLPEPERQRALQYLTERFGRRN